jgi:hypothetical protein
MKAANNHGFALFPGMDSSLEAYIMYAGCYEFKPPMYENFLEREKTSVYVLMAC